MKIKLPKHYKGHVAALTGALLLHSAVAAWAIQNEYVIEDTAPQVIKITMAVAPTKKPKVQKQVIFK